MEGKNMSTTQKKSLPKINDPRLKEGQKPSDAPMEHYRAIYRSLQPEQICARTGLIFEPARSVFLFRLMGEELEAEYPEFSVKTTDGTPWPAGYQNILFIRYLCEGKYAPGTGQQLSYPQLPWGSTYADNFNGRVIRRFLGVFGKEIHLFRRVMEETPTLKAELLEKCDAGYRFEFINGIFISVLLWEGDDEFPSSAQVLFDDNMKYAFTAEDVAVAMEIMVGRLKRRKQEILNEDQR
jgi:hypothetical protein